MIEQTKFTYSSLRKASKNQIKTIDCQRRKQAELFKARVVSTKTKSIENILPKDLKNNEIKN